MAKKFSKPELSRKINGDLAFDEPKDQTKEEHKGLRFDVALANEFPYYSRAAIQKFIKKGLCSHNDQVELQARTIIQPDEELKLNLPEEANEFEPEIVYEDEHVILFNKPAGMLSVSKGPYNSEKTIESYGLIVHRLDRETSGIIIVAKDEETRGYLQKQFQDRKTHKTYYAVVVGHPKLDHAIIDVPLTRNLKKPTTFMISPTGREAQTEYTVKASNDKYSLIELKPRTGRTHQLRIHMAHIGTPILGDKVYNPKSPKAERMFLHACSLEITIPGSKRLTFNAELPKEFLDIVK